MTRRFSYGLALPVLVVLSQLLPGVSGAARAEPAAKPLTECDVPDRQQEINFPLLQVTKAISAKKLNILVLGAGSSQIPGATGVQGAYPARLEKALADRLPGVTVTVATDIKPTRTALDMVKTMKQSLTDTKPSLVIWQTATFDAMQSVDAEQFNQALAKGIKIAKFMGSDVIFLNPQYSPRTESMIALASYIESMRWVAMQHEVPVFDRFNLMKSWQDLGTFDLYSATKKVDMAERVHDCIGRLLADLVVDASKAAN